jgi:peptidylprolyl isomerase
MSNASLPEHETPPAEPAGVASPRTPRRFFRWTIGGLLLAVLGAALILTLFRPDGLVTTPSGLGFRDDVVGTGVQPTPGQTCVVHYTGWIWQNGKRGAKFDSSVDRGQPFEFRVGAGQVIKGWDEGVETMKVGGKRTLRIPSPIAYGASGAGGVIPPNATLHFEIELLGVK